MNSRHPDPRRVRTGGREQQSAYRICRIRGISGIRGIRGWVPFFNFLLQKSMVCGSDLRHSHLKRNFSPLMCNPLAVSWPQNALAQCFFDFFGTVLYGLLTFEYSSGKLIKISHYPIVLRDLAVPIRPARIY